MNPTTRMLKITLLIHLIAPGLLMMSLHPRRLYAMPRDGVTADVSFSAQRDMARTGKVRIEGELSCAFTEENTQVTAATNCALNIKDNRTGTTYRLVGQSDSALELFRAGTRKIAVEGTIAGGHTVSVQQAQAL